MRFSSALKFNAVSEWWEYYIDYDSLKKYIYQLEKQQQNLTSSYRDLESNERTSLVGRPDAATDSIFIPLLDKELKKVTLFYEHQGKELFDELDELEALIHKQDELGLDGDHYADDDGYDEEDDESISRSPERQKRRRLSSSANANRNTTGQGESSHAHQSPVRHRYSTSSSEGDIEDSVASLRRSISPQRTMQKLANTFGLMKDLKDSVTSSGISETIWTARTNYAYDTRLLFKRRITNLYVSFSSLRSYVEVNRSGFRKILKK
ncbi:SPX domain-containing protein [Lentinula aff. detonsa]|nr:SPX domain-containing protein [Lentinula aff. detonsa]